MGVENLVNVWLLSRVEYSRKKVNDDEKGAVLRSGEYEGYGGPL